MPIRRREASFAVLISASADDRMLSSETSRRTKYSVDSG